MNNNEEYQKFYDELTQFVLKFSITRLKISTANFDREYELGQDGRLILKKQKAIIRVLGHTTKVPIGEGEEYKTFEQAESATKAYWTEYYRNIRANRSPEQVAAEHKRQKRYREKQKAKRVEIDRRQ